jgi:AraC-like DNA-binding protein
MIRSSRPAFDPRIRSVFAVSRDGQPLSYNRAPAPDLADWIARLYVARIDMPADHTLHCGLFGETGAIRIQLSGAWRAQTRDGIARYGNNALFFGPDSRLMPISVTGGFTSLGIVVRPGACMPLLGARPHEFLDRVRPTEDVGLASEWILAHLERGATPEEWLLSLERMIRGLVADARGEPDPLSARFEEITYRDPAMTVAQAARAIGVERRRLERVVSRDFGLPPKQVLKRARALDMASYLRGVADDEEAEALALRYYDESHLIHEFDELFGMSPRQFTARALPILTLTLEARQARRLELLGRIKPGALRPWQ